jgi:hypothetical protein
LLLPVGERFKIKLGTISADATVGNSFSRVRTKSTSISVLFSLYAGGSDDWAKGGAGIKYSYTVELADTGRHGFVLPAKFARSVSEEATAMAEAMIESL